MNVREELIENPVTLHGVPVKVKEKDPYIGFIISQDRFVASVNETIKSRKIKKWMRTLNIKSIINNPMVKKFGCLKAGIVLVKSILPSILAYSSEVWPGSPKYLMDTVENQFKKMVYNIYQKKQNTMQC